MSKRIIVICYVSIVALTLSGCIGFINNSPVECNNETPYTGVYDFFQYAPRPKQTTVFGTKPVPIPTASTKTEFLREWGKPDEVIRSAESRETWIYKRKLWCGVIPVLLLPVPFILPVCDGFERIEFQGDIATRLHSKHIASDGFILMFAYPVGMVGGGSGGTEHACRYPIPTGPAYLKGDKIPDDAGLVIFYRQDLGERYYDRFDIKIGAVFITRLYFGSYYPYLSTIGEKEFQLDGHSKSAVTLDVKPGQTYYIKTEGGHLRTVDKEIAEKEIADCMLIPSPQRLQF